jgi:predicted dehydrogenase
MARIKILVVGCGNMGASHAQAYHEMADFEIVGLVSRGDSKHVLQQKLESNYPLFEDYDMASPLILTHTNRMR